MAESLFASLLHTLDKGSISGIARSLGESETSVSRGIESSIATVLGGLSAKSEEPGLLRKMLDLAPGEAGGWTQLAGGISGAAAPLLAGGRRILSGLFGNSESAITNAISHESGLGVNATSTILAMAGPMVMGLLGRKVRDGDITMSGLSGMLQREASTIRSALPSGVSDLIWRREAATPLESPVIAQSVQQVSSFPGWAGALMLGALALGALWLFTHGRRTVSEIGSATTGAANRLANEATDTVKRHVPTVELRIPGAPGETKLLAFVQDPALPANSTAFDFDRLRFNTGSAQLRAESAPQLDDVAAILAAYPNVRAKICGYTDARGNGQSNMALSEARADTVRSQLMARGVAGERLTAEGFGPNSPIADNATDSGRAENRRVALLVVSK